MRRGKRETEKTGASDVSASAISDVPLFPHSESPFFRISQESVMDHEGTKARRRKRKTFVSLCFGGSKNTCPNGKE
jgi:hypothetical protein